MRKLTVIPVLICVFLHGCVNLYTRLPATDAKIESTYQSTKEAAMLSTVIMFPQIMSDAPTSGLMWENVFTVPLGCLGLCDAACEAVFDTVLFLPDYMIAAQRRKRHDSPMAKSQ